MDLAGKTLGLVHLVDAGAGDVELPAVIDAAQPVLLVAPQPERDAAMGAELLKQANAAEAVTKRDEVLAQQPHAHRSAVRSRQLTRQQRRQPVAPQQLPSGRPRPDLRNERVVFG